MNDNVIVTGAEELEVLGRQLKELGDKELRRDLFRGFSRATKPLKEDVRRSALRSLPSRGGLNQWVADAKLATRTRVSGKTVGVRIAGSRSNKQLRKSDLNAINRGRLRHPVFGNRKVWVTQMVKPGWFTDPLVAGADEVRQELVQVMDDVAERLARG